MFGWPSVLVAFYLLFTPSVGMAARPTASSELEDADGLKHAAAQAFDGLLKTGWAEGGEGHGEGAWISLPFDKPTEVSSVSVWAGNLSMGARSLREYSRPRTLTVALVPSRGDAITTQVLLPDGVNEGLKRIDIVVAGTARSVKVTIDDVYEGYVFSDTFISEIAVNFIGGSLPEEVFGVRDWQTSDPANLPC